MISITKLIALNKLIANLKTVSSRYLRQEFPQIKNAYHKPVFWTASYFVASCGGVTVEQLKKYVQNLASRARIPLPLNRRF